MLMNLLIGLPTMLVCLFLQSILFISAIHYYRRQEYLVDSPSFWSSLVVITGVMMMLLFGNLAQIAIWAELFLLLGEFQQFDAAFYHSAVNFSTLGYGDIVMSEQHKFLGPLEAINGVLMIGVSTSALMTAFQDSMRKTLHARGEDAS
jgi:hypothetical protein